MHISLAHFESPDQDKIEESDQEKKDEHGQDKIDESALETKILNHSFIIHKVFTI